MRCLAILLALFAATAYSSDTDCERNSWGDLPQNCESSDQMPDVYPDAIANGKDGRIRKWELTLIKVNGEFAAHNEPDWRFYSRIECLEDGIYRVRKSIQMKDKMTRNDDGSIGATYTQYLGFICKDVTEDDRGQ